MTTWQPISTAPQNGVHFWGWLYDQGIRLMHWNSEIEAFVLSTDPEDEYEPAFWAPYYAITLPPGVVWKSRPGRWRDVA